jgi:hypothetical protein
MRYLRVMRRGGDEKGGVVDLKIIVTFQWRELQCNICL